MRAMPAEHIFIERPAYGVRIGESGVVETVAYSSARLAMKSRTLL